MLPIPPRGLFKVELGFEGCALPKRPPDEGCDEEGWSLFVLAKSEEPLLDALFVEPNSDMTQEVRRCAAKMKKAMRRATAKLQKGDNKSEDC